MFCLWFWFFVLLFFVSFFYLRSSVIISLFLFSLLFIIQCVQRQHALGILRMMVPIWFIIYHYYMYLLFSVCSDSMREGSCGSMTSTAHYLLFMIHYLLIYYSESAAAARVKHLAGHANTMYYLLFIIYYLLFIHSI